MEAAPRPPSLARSPGLPSYDDMSSQTSEKSQWYLNLATREDSSITSVSRPSSIRWRPSALSPVVGETDIDCPLPRYQFLSLNPQRIEHVQTATAMKALNNLSIAYPWLSRAGALIDGSSHNLFGDCSCVNDAYDSAILEEDGSAVAEIFRASPTIESLNDLVRQRIHSDAAAAGIKTTLRQRVHRQQILAQDHRSIFSDLRSEGAITEVTEHSASSKSKSESSWNLSAPSVAIPLYNLRSEPPVEVQSSVMDVSSMAFRSDLEAQLSCIPQNSARELDRRVADWVDGVEEAKVQKRIELIEVQKKVDWPKPMPGSNDEFTELPRPSIRPKDASRLSGWNQMFPMKRRVLQGQ